eukprot:scaffold2179_cov84-Isochrysis_galbana.AAC.1
MLERVEDVLVLEQPALNLLDQVVHGGRRDDGAVSAVPVQHAEQRALRVLAERVTNARAVLVHLMLPRPVARRLDPVAREGADQLRVQSQLGHALRRLLAQLQRLTDLRRRLHRRPKVVERLARGAVRRRSASGIDPEGLLRKEGGTARERRCTRRGQGGDGAARVRTRRPSGLGRGCPVIHKVNVGSRHLHSGWRP